MTSAKAVLLVDDDADILEVTSLVLESAGYRVMTARDGTEALDQLRRNHDVGLILLDMMMPGMDGWQFREEQQRDPDMLAVPVVVMTGDGRAREKAETLGAAGFLRKPLDVRELLSVVDDLSAPT